MKQVNGSIKKNGDMGLEEHYLFTYDEEERQKNQINKENAKRVFSPKFIPYYPKLSELGLTVTEILIFGFLDFYIANGTGRFYFTNEQISLVVNCSPDTVSRTISKLEKLAMIQTNRKVKAGGGQIRFIDLAKNYKSTLRISTSLSCEKLQTNKNKIKENKIKENKLIRADAREHENIVLIFNIFKRINPLINYGHTTNRKSCKKLINKFGLEESIKLADVAVQIQGQKYAPTITTPYQLETKLGELKIYIDKEQANKITRI